MFFLVREPQHDITRHKQSKSVNIPKGVEGLSWGGVLVSRVSMIGPCYDVPCFDMSYLAFFPSSRLAQVKHICRFVGQNGMEGF